MKALLWSYLSVLLLFGPEGTLNAQRLTVSAKLSATLNLENETFRVIARNPRWTIGGTINGSISDARTEKGTDAIGSFEEIIFSMRAGAGFKNCIRVYRNKPVAIFTLTCDDSIIGAPPAFPVISAMPAGLHVLSYAEREFGSPPEFSQFGGDTAEHVHSGPLLLFDDRSNACIISPSENFMTAGLSEKGPYIRCGANADLKGVPKGYSICTIVVIEPGINRAWETWGHALTDLHRKHRPANDADTGLKYLGYWTDNGATYYYNYRRDLGYEGTLLTLKKEFDQANIPIRYMQLDSWWYEKGYDSPDGLKEDSVKKTADLPAGTWNRYGGMMKYVPSADLFPDGLRSFRDSLGLPLITHNRWISRRSPDRREYRISGIGAVDPRWWDATISSVAKSGVVTYEQDWLDRIYKFSPEFSSTTWAAKDFCDDMSRACAENHVTMQYCMALPRHYLQGGAMYDNLTSIRVSGDRFERMRWKEFLYGSRLAGALGIWPWSDVFMSRETGNILLATLSAGMVGIGDAMGEEDPVNIHRSVRLDGVIVKPDAPLVPIDDSYLADARGSSHPRIATTYTIHGRDIRTMYAFAYADTIASTAVKVAAVRLGVKETAFAYDYFAGTGRLVHPGDTVTMASGPESWSYTVFAPVGRSGIAFVGDPEKFVTCGKERIESLDDKTGRLTATLVLAKGEDSIEVCGYSAGLPTIRIEGGSVLWRRFSPESGFFTINLLADTSMGYSDDKGDPVRRMTVSLSLHR